MLDGLFQMLIDQTPAGKDVSTKDFTTKADDGHEILCRWYTKNDTQAPGSAVLYAHGGGYIALKLEQYDAVVKRYVSRTGVPFMSVEYRLAPENQFPAGFNDCLAAVKWVGCTAVSLIVATDSLVGHFAIWAELPRGRSGQGLHLGRPFRRR